MNARDDWRRAYRCARIAGLDFEARRHVERMRFGLVALRLVDARQPISILGLLVARVAVRWVRRAVAA